MVFNAIFNNISAISGDQIYWWGKPDDPEKTTDLSQQVWRTLSHNVEHLALIEIRTHNISRDGHCICSCKAHYHAISSTTPSIMYAYLDYYM